MLPNRSRLRWNGKVGDEGLNDRKELDRIARDLQSALSRTARGTRMERGILIALMSAAEMIPSKGRITEHKERDFHQIPPKTSFLEEEEIHQNLKH